MLTELHDVTRSKQFVLMSLIIVLAIIAGLLCFFLLHSPMRGGFIIGLIGGVLFPLAQICSSFAGTREGKENGPYLNIGIIIAMFTGVALIVSGFVSLGNSPRVSVRDINGAFEDYADMYKPSSQDWTVDAMKTRYGLSLYNHYTCEFIDKEKLPCAEVNSGNETEYIVYKDRGDGYPIDMKFASSMKKNLLEARMDD